MKIVIFIFTIIISAILFVTYDKISQPEIEQVKLQEQNITEISAQGDVLNSPLIQSLSRQEKCL